MKVQQFIFGVSSCPVCGTEQEVPVPISCDSGDYVNSSDYKRLKEERDSTVDELDKVVADLHNQLYDAGVENDQLKEETANRGETIVELGQEITRLEDKLYDANMENMRLEKENTELRQIINQLGDNER